MIIDNLDLTKFKHMINISFKEIDQLHENLIFIQDMKFDFKKISLPFSRLRRTRKQFL